MRTEYAQNKANIMKLTSFIPRANGRWTRTFTPGTSQSRVATGFAQVLNIHMFFAKAKTLGQISMNSDGNLELITPWLLRGNPIFSDEFCENS
jgi:hypothetical protein